jgi:hypothetical protein
MAGAYGPGATFSDPVFVGLRDGEPGAMWRMLTGQAHDLQVELLEHATKEDRGAATWRATYTFSQTGRKVVNLVDSSFRFDGGLIAEQRDDFDFYRWSRQALGPMGMLLGWSPIVKAAVRKRARASLDRFMGQRTDERD